MAGRVRGEQAVERVETLRTERSGAWKPRASGPADPASAEGRRTPREACRVQLRQERRGREASGENPGGVAKATGARLARRPIDRGRRPVRKTPRTWERSKGARRTAYADTTGRDRSEGQLNSMRVVETAATRVPAPRGFLVRL